MMTSAFPTAVSVLWVVLHTALALADSQGQEDNTRCPPISSSFSCHCVTTTTPPDLVCTLQSESHPLFQPATSTLLLNSTTDSSASVSIRTLDLSGISLSNISERFLEGVGSVENLRAQHCGLMHVPQAFLQLPGLRVLDLSHNNLTSFSMDTIAQLSVHHLDLSTNSLQQITVGKAFPSSLVILGAGHNKLRRVPPALLENLSELDLSNNALAVLPEVKSSKMTMLAMNHNHLTHFPGRFFTAAPLLQMLKVSGNQIRQWGRLPHHFTQAHLKHLDLSHNHLQAMSHSLLNSTPQLTHLNLSYNHLTQLSPVHFPSQADNFQTLDLSHNALSDLHSATFVHMQCLRLLNLSDNVPLGESGPIHLQLPDHLVSVDLQNCSLLEVDFCQLNHLHDLKHLLLKHNPLQCSCHLYLLYQWYRSHAQDKAADSLGWSCESSPGEVTSAAMIPPCSASAVHCPSKRSSLPTATEMQVAVSVVRAEHYLITSWTLLNDLPAITGFRVLCLHPDEAHPNEVHPHEVHPGEVHSSQNAAHISPILGATLRSYTLPDFDVSAQYMMCVDVMHNHTHALMRVCRAVQQKGANILVGILAGSIFLVPCLIFIIYIAVKDKRINNKYRRDDHSDYQCVQSLPITTPCHSLKVNVSYPSWHQDSNTAVAANTEVTEAFQ